MKSAGFDWLFIDLEHGALSIETASQMCLAGLDAGISPLVRIPNGEYSLATRLLDNGALGIVVPHVETADGYDCQPAALPAARPSRCVQHHAAV